MTGWQGENCTIDIDDCSPNRCQNGGTCTDMIGRYQCTCTAGYTGMSSLRNSPCNLL